MRKSENVSPQYDTPCTKKSKRIILTLKWSAANAVRIARFWSHFQKVVILTLLEMESMHFDVISKRVNIDERQTFPSALDTLTREKVMNKRLKDLEFPFKMES